MAFGPLAAGGKYTIEFGPKENNPIFKGGGNIMYVGDIVTADATVGTAVDIPAPTLEISTSKEIPPIITALEGPDSIDSGKYSIANSTYFLNSSNTKVK